MGEHTIQPLQSQNNNYKANSERKWMSCKFRHFLFYDDAHLTQLSPLFLLGQNIPDFKKNKE